MGLHIRGLAPCLLSANGMLRARLVWEGMLVGLAGAVAVAVWFFIYDLAKGTPFRTPALLGAALFDGLRDPASLTITPALVLEYTVVHGLVFLAFGLVAAGLFALADHDRHVLFAVFMLFCCFEVAALAAMAVLASWLLDPILPWAITGANFVAALVMLGILFRHHHVSVKVLLTSGE
jgi:hypothetical protein